MPEISYVCDICLFQCDAPEVIAAHMQTEHGLAPEQTHEVGRVLQENGILTASDQGRTLKVDLEQWLKWAMSGYSDNVPNGLLEDIRSGP